MRVHLRRSGLSSFHRRKAQRMSGVASRSVSSGASESMMRETVMAGGRVTNLDLPEHEQLTMC